MEGLNETSAHSATWWITSAAGIAVSIVVFNLLYSAVAGFQTGLEKGSVGSITDSRPFQLVVLMGVAAPIYAVGAATSSLRQRLTKRRNASG